MLACVISRLTHLLLLRAMPDRQISQAACFQSGNTMCMSNLGVIRDRGRCPEGTLVMCGR